MPGSELLLFVSSLLWAGAVWYLTIYSLAYMNGRSVRKRLNNLITSRRGTIRLGGVGWLTGGLVEWLDRLGARLQWLFPGGYKNRLRESLGVAGFPGGLTLNAVIGGKSAITVLSIGLICPVIDAGFALAVVITSLCFFLPDLRIASLGVRRQDSIQRDLPFALDLLTVSVEAGLGFEAAMRKVADKPKLGPLGEEFRRTLREMQVGRTRGEALRAMAKRTKNSEVSSLVLTLIQADQLGTSIAGVLRILSDQSRSRRSQRAESDALQAPVKMLFPLLFFIFPAILVVFFGPVFLSGVYG